MAKEQEKKDVEKAHNPEGQMNKQNDDTRGPERAPSSGGVSNSNGAFPDDN